MYGKWVTLKDDGGAQIAVWVDCTPDTPEEELIAAALRHLKHITETLFLEVQHG